MTVERSIDYDALTQDALRGVVRTILTQVAKTGLPGEHHFYVAFDTQAPGVSLSRRLKDKYPEEMMIVLQHRFWDLAVSDEQFEVKLTFDGIPERLVVPFQSIRVFFDPSVRFTLQFGEAGEDQADQGTGRRRRREGAPAEGDGQRNGRIRPRTRPRTADEQAQQGDGLDAVQHDSSQPQQPVAPRPQPALVPPAGKPGLVAVPKAVPAAASAAPTPAAMQPEPSEAPAAAGAKVFSLDQFRKK